MPTEYFDKHDIVATLRDGRLIAMGERQNINVAAGDGLFQLNVRLPDLKYIENIVNVQFDTTPLNGTHYVGSPAQNKVISGNIVGLSLYLHNANGLTLTSVEVKAVGPP